MATITFNPDSAGAWTAQLKDGENTIGRADDNDIRVPEDGVSGHHCRVAVNNGTVTITDLNSTNGTLFNGSRIHQLPWAPGGIVQLGPIYVRLEPGAGGAPGSDPAPGTAPSAPPVPSVPVPVAVAEPAIGAPEPVGLRLSRHPPAATTPPATVSEGEGGVIEEAPAATGPAIVFAAAGTNCRSHGKIPAGWTCPKCHKYFCDLCVSAHATSTGASHLCRGCGVECAPVRVEAAVETGGNDFFGQLPGAFLYPLRGIGVFVLIFAAVIFEGSSMLAGVFSIILKMAITGYLFVFMQDVIHGTAVGEEKMPGLPDFDGLFVAFFKLFGTVLVSFIIPIGLAIAKFSDVEIPTSAFVASIFVSLLYFPMAFLAVAVLDSVAAANPLVVVPSILRVPGKYLVTVVVIFAVYGVRLLGSALMEGAKAATFTTTDMSVLFLSMAGRILWSLFSVYLMTVSTRILGLLYRTQKEELGW